LTRTQPFNNANFITAAVEKMLAIIAQKNIRAPFDGKLGIRLVDIGQFVSVGTPLVTLQAIQPLNIDFSVPEQYLKQISVDQLLDIFVDAYKDEKFKGVVHAIDSKVNVKTHNILVQGLVENKDLKLYPGMFAHIEIVLPSIQNVITIPQTAIDYSLYGDSVYIIEQKGKDKKGKPILKAKRTFVTLGQRRGNEIGIIKGLSAGQEVVTSGQLKLNDGTHVQIDNSVKLGND